MTGFALADVGAAELADDVCDGAETVFAEELFRLH